MQVCLYNGCKTGGWGLGWLVSTSSVCSTGYDLALVLHSLC